MLLLGLIAMTVLGGLGILWLLPYIEGTYPEYANWATLAFIILIGAVTVVFVTRSEAREAQELAKKRLQYQEIGKVIFSDHADDFQQYYDAYLRKSGKKGAKAPTPIRVLHDFAEKKERLLIIDWRGEENEEEVEEYIEAQLGKEVPWRHTTELRKTSTNAGAWDGKFIAPLFTAIDQDLKALNKRLLFLVTGSDSFTFIVTDATTFDRVMDFQSEELVGIEKLKA